MKSIARLFKSLSDPVRIRIVWQLQDAQELCVCDLMEVLELPQSTISRHLAYLRNVGLVSDERRGVWMYYQLLDRSSQRITDILNVLRMASATSDTARDDARRLRKYLKNKVVDAC